MFGCNGNRSINILHSIDISLYTFGCCRFAKSAACFFSNIFNANVSPVARCLAIIISLKLPTPNVSNFSNSLIDILR